MNRKTKKYVDYPYLRTAFEDLPAKNFNQIIATPCEAAQATVPQTSIVASSSNDTSKEKDKGRSTAHEVRVHIGIYSANRMNSFRHQFNPLISVFKAQWASYLTSNVFLVQWKLV